MSGTSSSSSSSSSNDDNTNNNNNIKRKMKKLTNKNLHKLSTTYETSLQRRIKLTIKEPVKKLCRCPIKTDTVIAPCDVQRGKERRLCQLWHVLLQPSADTLTFFLFTNLQTYLLIYSRQHSSS